MTKEHMTEVMNKKKSGSNQQSGRKGRGMSVNQVRGDKSDSELTSKTSDSESTSDASVTHIHRIRSKVANITFVQDRGQRTALQSDPDDHPKLKVTFKLDPESYKAAGYRKQRGVSFWTPQGE